MKNPSQRVLDLLPEIQNLHGPSIKKGWVGRVNIQEAYDLSQTEARFVVATIKEQFELPDGEIFEKGTYKYDDKKDVYILDTRSGELKVDGEDVRNIRRAYSNLASGGTGETVRKIAFEYDHLSLREIKEILRVMKVTHYSSPFTNEEFEDNNVDELMDDLITQRKIHLAKKFEHDTMKEIQEKAKNWDLFEFEMDQRRSRLIEEVSKHAPMIPPRSYDVPINDPVQAILFPADIHFGKLATFETSGTSYNIEICRQVVLDQIDKVLARLKRGYDIEILHLVVGNDWFHVDTGAGTTTSGTRLHPDAAPMLVMREGRKLAAEVVLHCLKYFDNIKITTCLSNHDYIASGALIDYLEAYFRNDNRVNVEVSLKSRNYFTYGNTLYGIAHGHGVKAAELPLLMAQEAKLQWGSTVFREFFLGHLHHVRSKSHQDLFEYNGVRVHHLPSLSATDDWHFLHGFVESIRSIEAHIIHPDNGRIGMVAGNIAPELRSALSLPGAPG